jgi:hypothetical protein
VLVQAHHTQTYGTALQGPIAPEVLYRVANATGPTPEVLPAFLDQAFGQPAPFTAQIGFGVPNVSNLVQDVSILYGPQFTLGGGGRVILRSLGNAPAWDKYARPFPTHVRVLTSFAAASYHRTTPIPGTNGRSATSMVPKDGSVMVREHMLRSDALPEEEHNQKGGEKNRWLPRDWIPYNNEWRGTMSASRTTAWSDYDGV